MLVEGSSGLGMQFEQGIVLAVELEEVLATEKQVAGLEFVVELERVLLDSKEKTEVYGVVEKTAVIELAAWLWE